MVKLNYEYYVARAQKAREMAEKTTDPGIREIHERMAKDYATLAELQGPPRLRIAE